MSAFRPIRSSLRRGLSSSLSVLVALVAAFAQPSAKILHVWHAEGGLHCQEPSADRNSSGDLHETGCGHAHEGAPHDATSCAVCRTLQQTAPRLATTDALESVLPARDSIAVEAPSAHPIRAAHGVIAPRAPPLPS